jgi:hypothetical protein
MICTSRADVRKDGAWIVRTDANRTDWSFEKGEMQHGPNCNHSIITNDA